MNRPDRPGRLAIGISLVVAVLLNGLLAFDNWWPTPAIVPLAQLAPEFLGLWLLLLLLAGRGGADPGGKPDPGGSPDQAAAPGQGARNDRPLSGAVLTLIAIAYLLLSLGRYVDVTSPALYGRSFSWYWDAPHLPALLAGATVQWSSTIVVALIVLAVVLLLAALMVLRLLIRRLAVAAIAARRSSTMLALSGAASLVVMAYLAGVQATWSWVSPPVSTGWWQQGRLAWLASRPAAMATALPASPRFTSSLSRVRESDVILIFAESYGAATIDDPDLARALQPARRSLARAINAAGLKAISAQVRSPTFGGGSWLAHAALLSGIDTRDPRRYPLLLASDRDNLVRLFGRRGHRTIALMPGLQASWPEGRFYDFDSLLDASALAYRGPAFGFWRIPDQYAIAKLDAVEAASMAAGETLPRFVVFATISSHLPFDPVPPIQPEWLALRDPYLRSLDYSLTWLGQWLRRPAPRKRLVIVVGDHQPAASVSGRDASWNVPVHVLTDDSVVSERLLAAGFEPGLLPAAPAAGDMPWLLGRLLAALGDAPARSPSGELTAPTPANHP